MSLVSLKNLVFQKEIVQRSTSTKSRITQNDDTQSNDTVNSSDLESQSMKKSLEKKSFRVDARVISDATIGLSDGLTVPFALTAGLSTLGDTRVVIYGGLAELIAGAISMGLGGFLGARSEAASYKALRDDEKLLIENDPQAAMAKIIEVFGPYNLPQPTLNDMSNHLADSPQLLDFIMHFHHCAEEPASSRAFVSATTIAAGYFLGGLLPLIPYFSVGKDAVYTGLYISIGVMVVALFAFGYVKTGVVTGWRGSRNVAAACLGGAQMVVVGSVAAAAAMGLVKAFDHHANAG